MSKACSHHYHDGRRRLYRRIFTGILAFTILLLFIIFLIWIILRPTKPRFILQDATLYAFNLSSSSDPPSSSPTTLSLTMQVSLYAKNPNRRIGIFYHTLAVHVAYRGQQISLPTALPPTYQPHDDFTVWSPYLHGSAVAVPPYAADSLREDRSAGAVLVNVKVTGAVKWKVGTWMSGKYHMYVSCPAYYKFAGDDQNGSTAGGIVGPAAKLQVLQNCVVDV